MKQKTLFLFFILLTIVRASTLPLIIKNNNIELGTLYEGTIRSNFFILSNNSHSPFQITSVKPTCGCTFAKPDTNLILPFATTKLRFTFNSMYFNGHYKKTILLFSGKQRYNLTFNVTVKPMFELSQKIIELGTISKKEVITYDAFIKLNSVNLSNVAIKNTIYNKKTMKVNLTPNKKLNRIDIKIILSPYFYTTSFSEPISIFLNIKNQRRPKRLMLLMRGKIKK